jgi:hypothetical protein
MAKQVRISDVYYAGIQEMAAKEKRTVRNMLDVLLSETRLTEREQGHQEVGARVSARQDTPLASPRRRSAGSPTASLVVSRSVSPDDWKKGGQIIPDLMEDDHFHPDPKPGKKAKK